MALWKIANQHPENPVGQFCYWHFGRIARVLRTQRPLYARDLMADKQRRLPLLPALKNYMSLKSPALRNAGRISVMMSIASLMGSALHLPKPYWILMTVLFVTKTAMARRAYVFCTVRSERWSASVIAGVTLHLHIPRKHYAGGHAGTNAGKLSDYS